MKFLSANVDRSAGSVVAVQRQRELWSYFCTWGRTRRCTIASAASRCTWLLPTPTAWCKCCWTWEAASTLRTMQVGLCTLVMRMGGCVILRTMQVGLCTLVMHMGGCVMLRTAQVGLGAPVVDKGGCVILRTMQVGLGTPVMDVGSSVKLGTTQGLP